MAGAPSAAAKAPRCPSGGISTAASWGVVRDDPTATLETDVPRTGLAAARTAEVRTTRTADGRHRRVLCTNGRLRVRLPSFGSRSLASVSVNGPYVAWAEVGRAVRTVVTVARVRGGRLRAVRRTRTATGTERTSVPDGGLVVLRTGTAAWTSGSGRKPDGAVWRRGHPVVPFARGVPSGPLPFSDDRGEPSSDVTVLDDRNVVVGAAALRSYRPPTPGRCPNLVVGTWRDLAGWQVADVGGYEAEGSEVIVRTERSVVCDPAAGRYLDVSTAGRYSEKLGSGTTAFGTVARTGRWLLRATVGKDDFLGMTRVSITDTNSGQRHVADGHLDAPGAPAPVETPDDPGPPTVPDARVRTGAVVVPGATAWIERAPASLSPSDDHVWLSDGAGTRVVASVPVQDVPGAGSPRPRRYVTGLAIAGNALTWKVAGVPTSVAVRPVPGEPFAVHPASN
jgi:hypothetical protein